MKDVKFTEKDLKYLLSLSVNKSLNNPPEIRFENYAKIDPFPDIPAVLLNSTDIIRYALTTGMIYEFTPENVDRATYICNFSGYYKYWNEGKLEEKMLNNNEEFLLKSNSIAFLETEQTFRVPYYLILRFNLKVQHVHKGLLLGTGPIVDPGFIGKLYIPLHNLTSNDYIIKKNAQIISVEFTKLNKYDNLVSLANTFDFTSVKEVYRNFEPRDLDVYIKKALIDDNFRKKSTNNNECDIFSVSSSIPDAIEQTKKSAEKAEKNVQSLKYLGFVGLGSFLLTLIGIIIAIFTLINNTNSRIDNVIKSQPVLTNDLENLKNQVENLKKENEILLKLQQENNNPQQGRGGD